MATFLNELPLSLRLIALGLARTSASALARELGLTRSQLNQHIRELRRACEDAGMRDYL
jgi:biotin operon repressor